MKKYLILLLFSLITTVSFGQSNYQDVVYLRNGSIIRGVIIEQVPNKSIKIETADKNVFIYQMDEIEKLAKEPFQRKHRNSPNNSDLRSVYKRIVELGHQIGVGHYGMDRLKLDIINAYQINPYFSLGFGTGIRYYYGTEAAVIPAFGSLKAIFIDKKVSPYLSLGAGYSFDATNGFKGVGFLFDPTVGASFKVLEQSSMNVGLGYGMQIMNPYYFYYNIDHRDIPQISSAISINVGISF